MANLIIFDDKEIREFTKDFSEERTIESSGAFGQVCKGRIKGNKYPNCPRKVAVKISKEKTDYLRTMWQQEIDALSSISHGNVIKLVGYAETKKYYALVYERAKQDLQRYIPSNKDKLDALLLGAARGLGAVHSAGFIHWDIQSRNLLLMKDGTVKIADFGLATKRNEKMVFFQDRRVGIFNANDTEAAQEKFDVFCFGNLMRELVLREKVEWSPTKCPRILLADDCTVNDPDLRPSMDEVVSKLKHIQKERIQREREPESKKNTKHSSTFIGSLLPRKKSK